MENGRSEIMWLPKLRMEASLWHTVFSKYSTIYLILQALFTLWYFIELKLPQPKEYDTMMLCDFWG